VHSDTLCLDNMIWASSDDILLEAYVEISNANFANHFFFSFFFFFCRLLKAGRAVVYTDWPKSHAVTHVLYKNTSDERAEKCGIPRYKVSYVAKHLLGVK